MPLRPHVPRFRNHLPLHFHANPAVNSKRLNLCFRRYKSRINFNPFEVHSTTASLRLHQTPELLNRIFFPSYFLDMSDRELDAVEAALTSLALAESEPALQKVVNRLLPGVLAALSTKSPAARAKCIETLQHINVRVRAVPSLSLPFNAVLDVAIAPTAAILTTNVAIQGGYLSRCFDRLSPADRAAVLPRLLDAAVTVASSANRASLHLLALAALAAASAQNPSATDNSLWRIVSTCGESAIDSFLDYALLALRMKLKTPPPEPALLAIVRLASEYAGAKNAERAARVFPHFLVAAGTTNRSTLMSAGEDAMKKVDTCDVLAAADPSIADKLFDLFVDTLAEIPLRIVVLSKGLLNVTLCASCFPEVLTVMQHSLITPGIPPRFQALGMQFASFVIKHSDEDALLENAHPFIDLLMKLVNNETDGSPSFPDRLRGYGFTGLSELVVRLPALLGANGLTTQMFFDAAQSSQLPPEVRSSASQALVALTRVVRYEKSDTSGQRAYVLNVLKGVLENLDDASSTARSAAVQWANECFQFSDCDARLLNIIAAADPRQDVRQLAADGLSPTRWHFKDGKKPSADETLKSEEKPSFVELVSLFNQYSRNALQPKMVEAYLRFAFFILKHEIRKGGKLELTRVTDMDTFFNERADVRQCLIELKAVADDTIFGLVDGKSANLEKAALCVSIFASKIRFLKEQCSTSYSRRIDEIISLTARKSAVGDITVACAFAYLIGVASLSLSSSEIEALVRKLGIGLEPDPSGVASGRDKEDERVAKILCFGQVIAQSRHRTDIVLDETESTSLSRACLNITRRIQLAVESCDIVRTAACMSLTEMGCEGPLPISSSSRAKLMHSMAGVLKLHSTSTKVAEAAAEAIGKICIGEPRSSFRTIAAESLLNLCKERKEDEIRFAASENLVRSSSGYDALPPTALEDGEGNIDMKSDSASSDALRSVLLMKTRPLEVRSATLDETEPSKEIYSVHHAINGAMKLVYDERPNARAGGCVCLFTFLRLLGLKTEEGVDLDSKLSFLTDDDEKRFKEVQKNMFDILSTMQEAFTVLLGDRSDFVQQLASCGVALVYQLCPPSEQKELVSSLVRSLTAGKARSATTVPGDQGTLLELGGGPDVKENTAGPKSATYKELCSLAQGMGQPELVYKFMDLAGHTALWNSRKGAALAGSALLGSELAAEQLRPHVKSLLPRLYVYCYDPTESVRVAMGSVLSAVVKAGALGTVFEAVTTNFDLITEYCLKSMTSRQWRTREAGCGALRDALTSRTWEQVKERLSDFWYYALRALDDIKESVRKAAAGTGRALSELSIHLCDPSHVGVDVASAAIAVVMPCVLPAVTHSATEVQVLAGSTLMKVIRYGGDALRSSVADLIGTLLETATELEPQELNYAHFHVDDPEALERARVSASSTSSSPLIEALERLCGLVDESNVEDTVRALVRIAKVGVGIPTRAGTSRLFATLLRTRAVVVQKYAGKLMHAGVMACGMEMSASLRSGWCTAVGIAAKLSSTEEVGKVVDRIEEFSSSDDSRERAQASNLSLAMWRQSADTARKHGSKLLPIAYMGCHEAEDDTSKEWKEVWSEGAPSTDAGLRLYAREITDLCVQRLRESTQYRVKRGAAAALGEMAVASMDGVAVEVIQDAARALLDVLPGHVWDGKIVAVESVGKIAQGCTDLSVWSVTMEDGMSDVTADISSVKRVVEALLREAYRGKSEYRLTAIEALTQVLRRARDTVALGMNVRDRLEEYLDANGEHVQGDGDADAMDTTNVSRMVWETGSDADAVAARNKARKARRRLRCAAVKCVEAACVSEKRMDARSSELQLVLQTADAAAGSGETEWETRLVGLQACTAAVGRSGCDVIVNSKDNAVNPILKMIVGLALRGASDVQFGAVRRASFELMHAVGETCGGDVGEGRGEGVRTMTMVTEAVQEVTQVQELWTAVRRAGAGDSDAGAQREARRVCSMYGI